ncbi:MAG: hypothetical protein GY756_19680 [bacterium]|nr:hypothetical protein [bacterium]
MYLNYLTIDISKSGYTDELEEWINYLLGALHDSRQIINEEHQFILDDNKRIKVLISSPEKDSLDEKYHSEYAKKWIKKISKFSNSKIDFIYLSKDPQFIYSVPKVHKSYIIYGDYFTPLICGETFQPIPLYNIPYTYHDNKCYNDLRSWHSNYEWLYNIWQSSLVGKRFSLKQLHDINSGLNIEGLRIRQRVETLTNLHTYYFLFNNRHYSLKKYENWKCPICNQNWYIKDSLDEFITFKCEKCRIVSDLPPYLK